MTTTFRHSSARIMRGTPFGPRALVSVTETPVNGSTSIESLATGDYNFNRTTVTPAINNCQLSVSRPDGTGRYAFVSATPSICAVDAAGNVTRVSSGAGRIAIPSPPHVLEFKRTFSTAAVVVTEAWTSWVANSLAAHVEAAILAMVSGKTSGAATQAVLTSSAGGASSPAYTRNASIFTGALDLSAITVYTTAFGSNMFPVVLISPRHVMAGHVGASPGQQIVFKAPDGSHVVRTVVSHVEVAPDMGDNYVGWLDSEITNITPMKLLPTTWASYVPSWLKSSKFSTLPVLNKGWTAGDYIRVLRAHYVGIYPGVPGAFIYLERPASEPLLWWSSDIIGGDSNGPVFIPVNGEPVLLHCMNFANGGGFYPANSANIQAAMTALGAGTLTYADLSDFTAF